MSPTSANSGSLRSWAAAETSSEFGGSSWRRHSSALFGQKHARHDRAVGVVGPCLLVDIPDNLITRLVN